MAIPHACFVQPELEFMRSCCLYSVYFQRQDFIKSNNTSGRPKLSLLVSYRKLQYVLVLEEELFPRNLPGYRGQKHMNMLSEIDLYLNHQTEYIFHRKLLGHMYIWHTQRIFQLFSQVRIEGLMRRDYGLFFFFFLYSDCVCPSILSNLFIRKNLAYQWIVQMCARNSLPENQLRTTDINSKKNGSSG